MSKKNDSSVETLENGSVYFFYRPRVEEEDPDSRSDISQLYMVLSPDERKRYRLMVIGRKQLPDPGRSGGGRDWGFVDMVRNTPNPIRDELSGGEYQTKTRGERHIQPARPAGEGIYRILRHGDHTHLVHALELPKQKDRGDVQKELEIDPEASYILSIKNPERGSPRAAGLPKDKQADFPKKLMDRFRDRKFAEADPPDFLDHEGAEFLLISASDDIDKELGIQLDTENESASSAEIFKDLHLDRSNRPTEPLFEGEWK